MKKYSFIVKSENADVRVDIFISNTIPKISRSHAKRLIDEGNVFVNGRKAKASKTLSVGDKIEVNVPPPVLPSAKPENIPLDVIYEDSDIIVVNKPAGMVVHPAAGHPNGTLVNALLYHCSDLSGIGGELKAGIVHRLDLGTSGVIIAAKNDEAHKSLAAQFKARTVAKFYLALVFGSMRTETGEYSGPIGRSTGDRKRMSGHTKKGRIALTKWRVLKRFGRDFSWLEIRLHTGRMHQIRVHFSEAGHPLVGDPLYGGNKRARNLPEGAAKGAAQNFPRPALHAWQLEITHPRTNKRMKFVAELPEDIKTLLLRLEPSL